MATGPTLGGARCTLEPFAAAHLTQRYVNWLNDADVTRHSEQRHRRHDLESCRSYVASFDGSPHLFWAIVAHDKDLGHVGNISAHIDQNNGVADVGILIGEKKCWGSGIGSEAWLLVCRYLLQAGGMRKVTAGTLSGNAGMLGIMRRAGMRDDGRRVRQCLIDGQEVDMVHAALFREDLR